MHWVYQNEVSLTGGGMLGWFSRHRVHNVCFNSALASRLCGLLGSEEAGCIVSAAGIGLGPSSPLCDCDRMMAESQRWKDVVATGPEQDTL